MKSVSIVGAGLAGCEAAYQLAKRGIHVKLWEMKPVKHSPAHTMETFGELVCSNSLRSDSISNAAGLLKAELRCLNSLIMDAADNTRVPAGSALAVDRYLFSEYITERITECRNISVIHDEAVSFDEFDDDKVIICSGPLSSDGILSAISELAGTAYLNFFDAVAPVVEFDSIDMSRAFFASRYGCGADYINCPLDKEEYFNFYEEIIKAECAEIKDFEHNIFEGCMPIEEIALRGPLTMCYGPLKPKGITVPGTNREPFANVQLRRENNDGTMYNIVGFQTHLKFGEQKRVFSMIPGLEHATFLRYGVMHKNTYINSPYMLDRYFCMNDNPDIYFGGQITGVEGYIESAASGFLAGITCFCDIMKKNRITFSDATAIGALGNFVSSYSCGDFQPMNINYGIIKPLDVKIKNKEEKNKKIAERSLEEIQCLKAQLYAL